MPVDLSKLSHPKVKAAITALQNGDAKTWFTLFTDDVQLYDDGNQMQFNNFFKKALGHERFTSIDKVENNGLDVYGNFHSDQWGDFKTFFKFQLGKEGKISRLEIGQASF
ncbi:MAG: hypothetical protein ABWZ79_20680 [Pedobacter agri]|uniref:hypothetical protein n=1 Tax=Pedobacter TaxID=84567 RepID=UPI000E2525F5|nr:MULTISPECIES: hypothetical protein [Pedobacter]AZI24757.1 hypothetical protein EA772_05130 [Pedobacter sp. G11]RYD78077.1 MAG: hypothetical protein EOP55_07955 [Sphingobacteriales bacterium]